MRTLQGASHHGVPNTATIFRVKCGQLTVLVAGATAPGETRWALLCLAHPNRAAATNRASVPTISYQSGSDLDDWARRACCARTTASSASTLFFSSSVRTALLRGGGMSWTAGKAGAICGGLGASCDMPPAETGNCAILEHEAREPAPADTSATPSKKWVNRQ
jgi:hypothetical protein